MAPKVAKKGAEKPDESVSLQATQEENIAAFTAITTYMGYAVLYVFGHLRDYLAHLTGWSRYFNAAARAPEVRRIWSFKSCGRTDRTWVALAARSLPCRRGVCQLINVVCVLCRAIHLFCMTGKISTLAECITVSKTVGIARSLAPLSLLT